MGKPSTLTRRLNHLSGVPHELCHYLAARLLGYPARLHLDRVDTRMKPGDWRSLVITLAPALCGVAACMAFLLLCFYKGVPVLSLLGLFWLVLWESHCWRDFYCAWILWREKRWPRNDEGPQKVPFIGV